MEPIGVNAEKQVATFLQSLIVDAVRLRDAQSSLNGWLRERCGWTIFYGPEGWEAYDWVGGERKPFHSWMEAWLFVIDQPSIQQPEGE